MTQRIRSKVKSIQLSEVLRIQDSGKMGISIQLYYLSVMHQLRNYRSGSIGLGSLICCHSQKYSRTASMIVGILSSTTLQLDAISGTLNPYSIHGTRNFQKIWPSYWLSLFIILSIGKIWRKKLISCGNGNIMPGMVGLLWFHCLPYWRNYLSGQSKIIS